MTEALKSVFVAGASGFIGRHLLSNFTQEARPAFGSSRARNPNLLQVPPLSNLPRADVVIYLAQDSLRRSVNALSPVEVRAQIDFAAAVFDQYDDVVFASTAALYGDQGADPHHESDAVVVTDRYSGLKLATEELALSRGGTVLRLANVYGPGQTQKSVMTDMIARARDTGLVRPATGAPIRDFVFIDDVVQAMARIVQSPEPGIFNLGTGVRTSVADLANRLATLLDMPCDVPAADTQMPVSCLIVDPTRAVRRWQLPPFTPLSHGLRATLESFVS